MKKMLSILTVLGIWLIFSSAVYAGSIPEDLLQEDGAKVFIGTVENYTTKEIPSAPYTEITSIEVIPTEKIKGDVKTGIKETYSRCYGFLEIEPDTEYLFGYFDENNFYIYEIESKEENCIKLVDSNKYDMIKRLEDYLNEGAFDVAEEERLNSAAETLQKSNKPMMHLVHCDDTGKKGEKVLDKILAGTKAMLWERVFPTITKNRGYRNGNVEPVAWLP